MITDLSQFEMLKADERQLAGDFQLVKFLEKNSNYLKFVEEMKKIVDRRFQTDVQNSWAKEQFVSLTKTFLEHSEPLFSHVSQMCAKRNNSRDISAEEWEHVCSICENIGEYGMGI